MRSAALAILLFASLTAGCVGDDPATQEHAVADKPLAVDVLDSEELVGRCNNAFRDQEVLVVMVRLTNLASTDVGPTDYDVGGVDEDGDAYPMCWPDEPVIGAHRSIDMELRFYVTDAACDVLHEVVVRQLFAGAWSETRVPTGIKDPCP